MFGYLDTYVQPKETSIGHWSWVWFNRLQHVRMPTELHQIFYV